MKKIVISDIHGNMEALNRVWEYIDTVEGEREIICLGDTVGYGPNPAECMEMIGLRTDKICLGNHDYAMVSNELDYQINQYALEAIEWTRDKLDDGLRNSIREFSEQIDGDNVLYVHASPDNPMEWKYISNKRDAESSMKKMDKSLCFVGHSHIPGVYTDYALHRKKRGTELSREGKSIVNVGSVGQPRDGSPLLSFAVFDDVEWSVEIVRLEYDVGKTMGKMERAGLPLFLAQRLKVGR
ncbi:MAG: metallophosphoesterase [Candidatus Scalindua sp. AMX11]|nr:MAG: metallophosphoesterase [Candidatus Scalindua sp.]NOG84166.1 metallophosphoesterase family protein [Planctomycetota bacterium]RZV98928.1 MAG: metallophosphoesterase [Candidatus Scalindua sp. SCAELEC01]TDE66880.1 MAG: metallophosphoesterase [Candidatus Scalindua sp. AMX11]GJQ57682.1 MAG: metallophosphatase family protein [Candidatus Scalindua sp.]